MCAWSGPRRSPQHDPNDFTTPILPHNSNFCAVLAVVAVVAVVAEVAVVAVVAVS
jgi:hypothetical protein